jgi:hypothetical protein
VAAAQAVSGRNLLNGLLALVILGLVLLVVFEPGKSPPPAKVTLTNLNSSDIQRIQISRDDKDTVVLEKRHDRWWLQQPYDIAASEGKVDTALELAHAASLARYPAQTMDAAQTGLQQPTLRISLGDVALRFGTTEPLQGRRYVQVGDTVHLINDRYSFLLRGAAASFVDSALLPADAALREIQLPDFSLHEEDGHWRVSGKQAALSADRLQQFVDEWRHARAMRVSATTDTKAGQAIELRLGKGQAALRFLLTKQDDETLLTRPDLGLCYHFTDTEGQRLLTLPTPPAAAKAQ